MGARDASQVPPPEPFVEASRKRVALGLLVGELIRTRGVKLDRALVDARLQRSRRPTRSPSRSSRPTGRTPTPCGSRELVIEDQVVELLLRNAKVKDEPATFKN